MSTGALVQEALHTLQHLHFSVSDYINHEMEISDHREMIQSQRCYHYSKNLFSKIDLLGMSVDTPTALPDE